jgi:DNA-directed RNA polymerase subunit beta'
MMDALGADEVIDDDGAVLKQKSFNSVFMMAESGAFKWHTIRHNIPN